MKTMPLRARSLALALLATTATCGLTAQPAHAQTTNGVERQAPDENGVDVISGKINVPLRSITAGNAAQGGLTYALGWAGGSFYDTFDASVLGATTNDATVILFGTAKHFSKDASGSFVPADADSTSLTYDAGAGIATYTMRDGAVMTFRKLNSTRFRLDAETVTRPDGEVLAYHYRVVPGGCSPVPCRLAKVRVQSITSNLGYMLKAGYASNDGTDPSFVTLATVDAINNAVDYCDPDADSCAGLSQTWPRLTLAASTSGSTTTRTFTDNLSQTTSVASNAAGVTQVTSPADPAADMAVGYDANGRVSSLTRGGGTWGYSYADSGSQRTTTVTQPVAGSKIYVSDLNLKRVLSTTDELSRTTSFSYDSFGRPTGTTLPEGNYTQLAYDGRGNLTQATQVAKAGSGLSNIVTSASYDAACANPRTCNQPNSTTDARGNTTDYTYDGNHGGLLTVTLPAPTTGAVRPQTRLGYSALSAYYKNSSGTIVAAPSAVYRLTAVSACRTGSSCAGTADEVKTTAAYGSSGAANNLLATSVSSGDGTGTLTATTAMTYDNVGNPLTVDGPLSGTADTVRYRWDADRRRVGTVSPDPDGAGPMKMRAERVTYNGDGNVTKVERGTVLSQSDADWTNFSAAEAAETAYDALGRPVTQSLTAGGTTYALTQTSYDAKGRPECAAQRMNPAVFGSLPSSACSLGTQGSYGPDRVVKTTYDAADQATKTTSAYGITGPQADDATATYTGNGLVQTLTDAEGNKTTYDYDGLDRLAKTRFPDTTKGAGTSSTTDYEQPTYETTAGGTRTSTTVASLRNRANETIGFAYDALGRLTAKDLPGSEPDVAYAYDLLGHTTSASQPGYALSFTYDALGRNLTQVSPLGTVTSQWDLAGNRTRLTWPDGYYVTYDHDLLGETTAIRENGAASGLGVLATFGYEDLGRRTGLTRGNGVVTSYGYDAASRLTSLGHDLAGTAGDLSLAFGYNPAGEMVGRTGSNDAYAFTALTPGSIAYAANGLNQLTSAGAATITYDAKGNITSDGTLTFGYSSENLLTSAGGATRYAGGTTMTYDPLMRLASEASWLSPRHVYDGDHSIAEYDPSGAVIARTVFGPGADEPLVWYGYGGPRLFEIADERGSIVATTGDSGALTTTTYGAAPINSYDEYGYSPAQDDTRHQYTGQLWLPAIATGVYYYKARVYHAGLGRFLQPDPIGYGDGMNIYVYVKGDPTNRSDPDGLTVIVNGPDGVWECEGDLCTWRPDIVVTGKRSQNKVELKNSGAVAGTPNLARPTIPTGRAGAGVNCLHVSGMGEGGDYNCRSATTSSSSLPPPPPKRTDEEKRLRNCELDARSMSDFGMTTVTTLGGVVKGAVGKAFGALAVATWYHDAIVFADKKINRCSE
ncbi:MAG TPA: RHS repeat-associated core domain-containing protein [Allosphingosinicella sp.]|jgi:RHS repeat-associated protein